METNGLLTGLIYQDKSKSAYQDLIHGFKDQPIAHQDLTLSEPDFNKLMAEFM